MRYVTKSTLAVRLREVIEDDIQTFYAHRRDPVAVGMVAFTSQKPPDFSTYRDRWRGFFKDNTIIHRTIIADGQVAGNITCFVMEGEPNIGYWLGREHWGKGIATAALAQFLEIVTSRPIYARVAQDNIASRRVLEKCGFAIIGEDVAFANARGEDVTESILCLLAP